MKGGILMAYSKKVRISIAVEPELNARIENLAKRMGMSKTSFCSNLIAQQITYQEKIWDIVSNPNDLSLLLKAMTDESNDDIKKAAKNVSEQASALIDMYKD